MKIHGFLALFLIVVLCSSVTGMAQDLELSRKDIETEGHPSLGPDDAPVTIVEFGDFQCPYCGALFPTLRAIRENYGDRVRIVFRQFPLIFTHQYAQKAAEASLCADDQGRFWDYHDSLFSNQEELDVPALKQRAVDLELNAGEFNQCLDSGVKWAVAERDIEEGTSAAVYSTPTMFVNGLIMEGNHPYANLARVIEAELERIPPGQ